MTRGSHLLILLASLAAAPAFGQSPEVVAGEPHQGIHFLEEIRAVVGDRPADHEPATITLQRWAGTSWMNSRRFRYQYEYGEVTQALTEAWTGHGWEPASLVMQTYNGATLVFSQVLLPSNGGWAPAERRFYSERDNQMIELRQQMTPSRWRNVWRSTYWMSSRSADEFLVETWSGATSGKSSGWMPLYRTTTVEAGRDVIRTWQHPDSQSWDDHSRDVYPDIRKRDLRRMLDPSTFQATHSPQTLGYVLRYPDNISQIWDGSSWRNRYHRHTDEDARDRTRSVSIQSWDGDTWSDSLRYIPKYDGSGRVVEIMAEVFASAWSASMLETRGYDANGRLLRITLETARGSDFVPSSQAHVDWVSTSGIQADF